MKKPERKTLRRLTGELLLAGTVATAMVSLVITGTALAQQPPPPAPAQQPAPPPPPGPAQQLAQPPPPAGAVQTTGARGIVSQYMLNPDGMVDGLLLSDNTIVRFPPHMSQQLVQVVRPQNSVQVDGFIEFQGVIHAMTITNLNTKQSVVDVPPSPQNPPPPPSPWSRQPMSVSGTIKVLTHAPRGEIDGAVLDNGSIVHVPPPVGMQFANIFSVGAPLAASGYGTANSYGRCLEATAIGPSSTQMQTVAAADERPGKRGHRGRRGRRVPPGYAATLGYYRQ
jgi:hypothetical protein